MSAKEASEPGQELSGPATPGAATGQDTAQAGPSKMVQETPRSGSEADEQISEDGDAAKILEDLTVDIQDQEDVEKRVAQQVRT